MWPDCVRASVVELCLPVCLRASKLHLPRLLVCLLAGLLSLAWQCLLACLLARLFWFASPAWPCQSLRRLDPTWCSIRLLELHRRGLVLPPEVGTWLLAFAMQRMYPPDDS